MVFMKAEISKIK